MASEIGWLIELKPNVATSPTWYGENEEGVIGWTRDHMLAVRFSRKDDAERIIQCEGLTGAFACEHAWGGGRSGPR